MEVDWSSGVRDRAKCTPDGLRRSAELALELALKPGDPAYRIQWPETAERLVAKSQDLEARP
jgi:hypothetical protein